MKTGIITVLSMALVVGVRTGALASDGTLTVKLADGTPLLFRR